MRRALQGISRSPETTGLLWGTLMLLYWPMVKSGGMTPAWTLLALSVFAAAAGMTVSAAMAAGGGNVLPAVRRGGQAGIWAALSGAAVYVLMASAVPFSGRTFWPLIAAAASLMPAMLAGTIAAALGMMCPRRPSITRFPPPC